MGYVKSMPLFCAAAEIIKYRMNNTIHKRGEAPVHLMDKLFVEPRQDRNLIREVKEASADKACNNLPAQTQKAELAHIEVFLSGFIGVVQGEPVE